MKYETFDQPAYGVGDLETFGITDNSGSLIMDFSQNSGMESWRADSLLSEDLQAYTQVTRAHEMGGDGGTIPPPPPPPGGSDDDDTSTDGSSSDTSGSGDAGSGDDVEEDTVVIEQGYDPTAELMQELMNSDSPDFFYQTEFGKLLEDYSSILDPSAIEASHESSRQDYWDSYQNLLEEKTDPFYNEDRISQNNPSINIDGDLRMANSGCNFRELQGVAETETGQDLTTQQILDARDKLIEDDALREKDLWVKNPDAVINDAFDRLGQPDTTATVGWSWKENDEPDYTQRKGERPKGDHYQLGDNNGNLLDDPHNPDLEVNNVETRAIYLHHSEENED